MRTLITVLVVALSSFILTTSAQPTKPSDDASHHAKRDWVMLVKPTKDIMSGVDRKSFQVVSQRDLFTFDFIILFRPGTQTYAGQPLAAAVGTIKASCRTKHTQVISDILISASEKIIARDITAKIDKMTPIEEGSLPGIVVEAICSGRSPLPQVEKQDQVEKERELRRQGILTALA